MNLGISLYAQKAGEGPLHLDIAGRRHSWNSASQSAYMLDGMDLPESASYLPTGACGIDATIHS